MQGIFFENFATSYIPEILKELYRDRIYDQFLVGKKDLTILDIGGNIGLFSFFAYPFAKKIYIVEPSKQHVKVIKEMLSYNKMDKYVVVVEKALGGKNGTADFHHNTNATMFSLKSEVDDKTSATETVEVVDMDTLFTQNNLDHVDFVKLDVEGSEIDVVNSEGFAKVADKIDAMVIELHAWAGRNPSQLTTTLMDLGFEVFPIKSEATLFGVRRKK